MNYQYKSDDYYNSLKCLGMKDTIEKVWCGTDPIRGIKYIGPNIYLFKKLSPTSCKDFFEKYTNYYNSDNPYDKNKGRSIEQFWNVAKEWKERVCIIEPNNNTSLETFMDLIILHAIVETFRGGAPEMEIINILKNKDYEILDIPPKFDSDYAIDIVALKNEKEINRIIQIKPLSTFISNNPNTKNDVSNFHGQNEKGILHLKKSGYIIPENYEVLYMLYDSKTSPIEGKSVWYYKIENNIKKFSFTINELLNENFLKTIKNNKSYISIH